MGMHRKLAVLLTISVNPGANVGQEERRLNATVVVLPSTSPEL